jgi:hypothetical protein
MKEHRLQLSGSDAYPLRPGASLGDGVRWLWRELTHDSAGTAPRPPPNPALVLASSSLLAACVIFAYMGRVYWLFTKEGPLEELTFVAELVAAALMALSARHVWQRRASTEHSLTALAYACLALLLFIVGMEEIGWGQQLFHFSTPHAWAEHNYQQETTLHNMLDRQGVNELGHLITYAFLAGVITLTALAAATRNTFLLGIAPHPSLIPLACAIALARVRLHGEIVEAFMAFYFLFYSYRAFRISRSDLPAPQARRRSGNP